MIFILSTKLTFIRNTRILFPQSRAPRKLILKIYTEYLVVCPVGRPGRKLGNLGNLGKSFSDVSFPSFRLRHRENSKTRKMKARKIFPRFPRFPRNPSFRIVTFDRTFKRVDERVRLTERASVRE